MIKSHRTSKRVQNEVKCALIDHDREIAFILPSRTHSQAFVRAYQHRYPLAEGASMHSAHFHKLITPSNYKIITFKRDPEERCISMLCKLLEPIPYGKGNGLADIYGLNHSSLDKLAHQLISISPRLRDVAFFYPQQKYIEKAHEIYKFNDVERLNVDFEIAMIPYHVSNQSFKNHVIAYFKNNPYLLNQLIKRLWSEDT
ncbi:MAG: hypothetical protein RLQ12_01400 [Cyclobacteriaceae bacterium]